MFQGLRPREHRAKVLVACRMNQDGRWSDVCVHNISSRGMLVAASPAPAPGSYVELRRGTLVVVGRVVWRREGYFGLRTQDRVSMAALVGEPRLQSRPGTEVAGTERRAEARQASAARIAADAERNRRWSASLQFVAMTVAVVAVALVLGSEVYELLARLSARMTAALAG